MTILTVGLFDIASDAVHKVSVQVPVNAEIVVGTILTNPPTSTRSADKPGVIFRVPTGSTDLETRNFIIVKDGQEVGGPDEHRYIGSYFPDEVSEHGRHIFEVLTPANS